MQFEPENKVNYLNDSFGLPELRYTPINRAPAHPLLKTKDRPAAMQNDENPAAEGEPVLRPLPKKRKPSVGRLVLVAAVLLFSGVMGMFYFADKNHALSSFNPFPALFPNWFEDDRLPVATTDSTGVDSTLGHAADLAHPDTNSHEAWGITPGSEEVAVSNEEPQPVAETPKTPVADNSGWSNAAPEPAPADNSAADELITSNTGRFYIIVAGFADRKGASRLKRKLEGEGQSGVRILLAPTGNRYKVSYADFEKAAEANAQVESVRGQFADAWVMKY